MSDSEEKRRGESATSGRVRVQFDFSKRSLDKLDELQTELQASTRAEVIRHALQLFTECVEARRRGAEVLLREPDGTMTKIILLV
jgi:hypothetical protein